MHGGKREHAGRKRGSKNVKTLERQKVLGEYQQSIMRSVDILFENQLKLALGLIYYFRVDKRKKKVVRITEERTIRAYLEDRIRNNDRFEYYAFTVKEPDIRAAQSLLDRAFGKPSQSVDISSDSKPIPLLGGIPPR